MNAYVSVIGTIFVDCKGFSKNAYHALSRNLGEIQFVHGGVGRNVVENLANLGLPTAFVSSSDATALGKEIVDRLDALKINTAYLAQSEKDGMGFWLAILDQNGDLAGSISQMPDVSILEALIASKGIEIVEQSSHIVLELDLNQKITNEVIGLANKLNKPVYGIPGNLDVILRDTSILRHLECFICNHIEIERIYGIPVSESNPEQMKQQVAELVQKNGLRSLVVTLGGNGSVYYDSTTREVGYQPVFPVNVVDTSGAGDAFFSGTVYGSIHNMPLKEAVVCGTRVAAWTIESAETTCRELSIKAREDELFGNSTVETNVYS